MSTREFLDEEVTRQGWEIYDRRLRSRLEPHHNGSYVAIDVVDGDFALGETSSEVSEVMRLRHPGRVFSVIRIGAGMA